MRFHQSAIRRFHVSGSDEVVHRLAGRWRLVGIVKYTRLIVIPNAGSIGGGICFRLAAQREPPVVLFTADSSRWIQNSKPQGLKPT